MTAHDRCATDYPHPAHRTQYGPFGVKDCPGVPITPPTAPTAPTAPDGPPPADEMVRLGDLSGYQLEPDAGDGLIFLRHRCGWTYEVDNPVIAYLANLIDGPVAAHRDAGCNPHEG